MGTESPGPRRALASFLAALTFFTRIPRPEAMPWAAEDERDAAAFAPLVGWVVGLASALAFWLCILLLPVPIAVLAAIAAGIAITGGLHEDGFADFCDGFGAPRDREATLAIMRDPRIGTFAALGLAVLLGAKCLALVEIALAAGAAPVAVVGAVLVAGHAMSRFVAVSFMATHHYVRPEPDARARSMSRRMSPGALGFAGVCGLAPLALPWAVGIGEAWMALVPVAIAWWLLARAFARRLGGYTGDCLGAAQQVAETVFYLGVCALLRAG